MVGTTDPKGHRRWALGLVIPAAVLLTAGCTGGDSEPRAGTDSEVGSTATQQVADDVEADEAFAPVVWDERSPMTLDWQTEGETWTWRGRFSPDVVPHGDMLATVATEPEQPDAGQPVYYVVVSSDGVEWQPLGDPLPPGNPLLPPGIELLSSGDRLTVRLGGGVEDVLLEQSDGSWQAAVPGGLVYELAAGPAGMLAFGLDGDGGPAMWLMHEAGFEPIAPSGLAEIDPATLQGVNAVGMPQGYLVRLLERGAGTKAELPTWDSADGIEWSSTEGPDPARWIGEYASVGETTILDTRDRLWITHDGTSWKPLELDNQAQGQLAPDGQDADVLPSGFRIWGGPNGFIVQYDYFMGDDRLFASPDGVLWLELTAPPTGQDLPPEYDFVELGAVQVLNTADSVVAREFVGGGWTLGDEQVEPATIRTLTAPAIEWP